MINIGKKKTIIAVVIAVVMLSTGFSIYKFRGNSSSTSGSDTGGINFNPPTEQEKQSAEAHKEEVAKQAEFEDNPPASSRTKSVTPVISSWGQNPETKSVEVTGYIGTIYESGGTCKVTLTKEDKNVTETTTSQKDVNRTSCPAAVIPASNLSPGQWSATLTYTSSTAQGTSSAVLVTVK